MAAGGPTVPTQRLEAPVPSAQTGADAFGRARISARMGKAASLAGADRAAEAAGLARRVGAGNPEPPASRTVTVGGRMFVPRDDRWIDAGRRDGVPTIEIAAHSEAYFAPVRALPQLKPYLSLGDDVTVAGLRRNLAIGRAGVERWGPGELQAIVRAFRGA